MKKRTGIIVLVLTVIITAFLGYTAVVGIGPEQAGAAKKIHTGLDLSGGVSITYQAVESNPSAEDMNDTTYKLQKRVEGYSTEAQVYQEAGNRINVEIPGVTDANAILEELGKPGSLCFVEIEDSEGNTNFAYDSSAESGYSLSRSLDEIREAGSVVLDGTEVADAEGGAYQDQTTKAVSYQVDLVLTDEGKTKFAEATTANVGKQIAIVYDNEIISAPRVNEAITGGRAQITGMSDTQEAQTLASFIRIGSLSLELEEMRSNVVAAQLGVDAIRTSIRAGIIGLILVMLLMIVVYYVPGVVASICLLIYTMLVLILLNAFEITLTLPGIAGIILGIGMAVDANVIIYARIREEIGNGISVNNAITSGFSKAFSAIFDGNVTTLIAAFVLMWLGSGPVKGFAYTLAMGIVVSMFTALVVARFLMRAIYAAGVRDKKFYGSTVYSRTIHFLEKRKTFFIVSLILILSGPVAMLAHKALDGNAFNYSLEFSGGTATNVTFNEDMSMSEIDSTVTPIVEGITHDANVQITKVVGSNQVIIKTRSLTLDEREALNQSMVDNFGVDESLISAESISATISGEMRHDAIVAVIVATIFMLLYIWFRFKDIRFGGSAVLALIHDVLVVLAFYAISRTSVGNTFIACMLTIVGYSINATIVIFDRIRENLRPNQNEGQLRQIVNESITQTLTRSIYTSLTTFIMVLVLFILGVSSIREFASPLMVGIIVGGYSSVCITGALWFVMRTKLGKKAVETAAGKAASQAGKPDAATKSASGKASSSGNGKNAEPKKKNRKRVAERLAAQDAAKLEEDAEK
ncbi:MAG: protein translocase subunit SecD [Blautia sp.]|nr:protein translocase subunit SecD [Blautia sp.]